MKKWLGLILFSICLLFTSQVQAEVSNGYRMGMLTDAKVTGWVTKSTECYLSMGVDGTPMIITSTFTDSKGKTATSENRINPWKFTFKGTDKISEKTGQYIWVTYTKSFIKNPFTEDTPYSVESFNDIEKSPLTVKEGIATKEFSTTKASGTLVGRIVQASYSGIAIKTYEATIQVGIGGGQYHFMTIADESLYNYVVELLKRGKLSKITYVDLGITSIGSFSNTNLRITKVEEAGKIDF